MATTAQTQYFISLWEKKYCATNGTSLGDDLRESAMKWATTKTTSEMSDVISRLLKDVKELPAAPEPEPGYYVVDDMVVWVQTGKSSGKPYAKKWWSTPSFGQKAKWVYAPGLVQSVAGKAPMTLEEAKEWGHTHGRCIRCGITLTDPVSVANGIGPVCAKYWGVKKK